MNIAFEKMSTEHQSVVMEIFNFYVENSTSAFADSALPKPFFAMIMKRSEGYPSYVLKETDTNNIIGFCQLSPYNPFSTFKATACVSYFIANEYTGKGLGGKCLARLEAEAAAMGVTNLLAEISSENVGSIDFHKTHGFNIVGELQKIGCKFARKFSIVYMQKSL
jgi:phosphinothricin acetyltransferase